jgi:hypothetical protein
MFHHVLQHPKQLNFRDLSILRKLGDEKRQTPHHICFFLPLLFNLS